MADKVFTLAELAQYDGQDGRPAYFAYEGQVYDASSIPNWKLLLWNVTNRCLSKTWRMCREMNGTLFSFLWATARMRKDVSA